MNLTWIFDYDDTLAPCEYCYSFAELKLTEWIMNKFGPRTPKPYEIGNLEVAIDKEAVKEFGFSAVRFPTSCRETYRKICNIKGVIPSADDLQAAYNIGLLAFDEKLWKEQGLIDGAKEALDFLLEQDDTLILLSKGDKVIQGKKFAATGVKKYFENKVYIVEMKNAKVLLDVCGSSKKDTVYHVGNSIRSDVLPALEAGINIVYIPLETWAWEMDHQGIPAHPQLKTLKKIIEIKEKYQVITS